MHSAHGGQSPGHAKQSAHVFIIVTDFACPHNYTQGSLLWREADGKGDNPLAAGRGLTGRLWATAIGNSLPFRGVGKSLLHIIQSHVHL